MAAVCLFVENQREQNVLKILCESSGYHAVVLPVEPASFSQILQYSPECIIMEIPQHSGAQLTFLKMIKTESRTSKIRILCFGDHTDPDTIQKVTDAGRITYFGRPLTTDKIRSVVRPKNRSADLHREVSEGFEGELDETAKIMDPATPRADRITIMADKIGELLAFPFTVAKVLSVTQSSTTGAADLAKAIEIDPVIVSALLKTANSALYGKVGQKISTIKDAIVRVGFTETKNIAVSLSVMMLFSDEENCVGFDREAFWYHSLAVGVIAGKLARQAGYPRHEIAFVGGLLHDFGIILLDEYYPTFMSANLRASTQKGISFLQEQQDQWKMTHNDVVCRLFEKWNMPEELLAPLQYRLKDLSWKHDTDRNMTILVHAVRAAEIMAHALSIGKECDETVMQIPQSCAEELKISKSSEDAFFKAVHEEINLFSTYLQLKRNLPELSKTIPAENRRGYVVFLDLADSPFSSFEYYLISREYQILKCTEPADIKNSDPFPEIIVIQTAGSENADKIKPYMDIYKPECEGAEPQNVPVLIIGPESERGIYGTMQKNCAYLADALDLRMFTFAVQRMILGESLEMDLPKPAPQEEPESPAPVSKSGNESRVLEKGQIIIKPGPKLSVQNLGDIKIMIGKAVQKTDTLIFDISDTECDKQLFKVFEEFSKALWSKKIVFIVCTIKTARADHLSNGIPHFTDDSALITHTESLKKSS